MSKTLLTRVLVDGKYYGPGPVSNKIAKQVKNPAAFASFDTEEADDVVPPETLDLEKMTIPQMKAFAAENEFDLGEAADSTERAPVIAAIEEAIEDSLDDED